MKNEILNLNDLPRTTNNNICWKKTKGCILKVKYEENIYNLLIKEVIPEPKSHTNKIVFEYNGIEQKSMAVSSVLKCCFKNIFKPSVKLVNFLKILCLR